MKTKILSWLTITTLLVANTSLALDWVQPLAASPKFLKLTSAQPPDGEKPTGVFKLLADDALKQLKAADPNTDASAWAVTEDGKKGLVIVCHVYHDTKIKNVTCDTCPNSLYCFDADMDERPKWLDPVLVTWHVIDHGWQEKSVKSHLKHSEIITTRKDTLCVEFPHEEVKAAVVAFYKNQ